jgi:lysophospholipase L1-like esterase
MVLRAILNRGYPPESPAWWVDEEGLCGRTTCREDPVEGDLNGLRQVGPILGSHRPLDLVVVMLGTNDLKTRFSPCPYDIAQGAARVVRAIQDSRSGPGDRAPKVLMICPPPTVHAPVFEAMFGGSVELSKQLPPFYRQFAEETGALFLDAGTVIRSSAVDGIHLDPEEHRKLAEAVAAIIAGL